MASQKEKDGKWASWQNLKEETVVAEEKIDKRSLQGIANFKGNVAWQKPSEVETEEPQVPTEEIDVNEVILEPAKKIGKKIKN